MAQPRWEVRAFLPQATAAEVVIGGATFPMAKRHKEGLYVALLDGEHQPYRIRVKLYDGESVELEDPYRFPPLLSSFQLHLHAEGTNYESYDMLGAHLVEIEGVRGTRFAVWAPNAETVTLVGDFNQWDTRRHPMRVRDGGIWEIFLPGSRRRLRVQVQRPLASSRLPAAQSRSLRLPLRNAAEIGIRRCQSRQIPVD